MQEKTEKENTKGDESRLIGPGHAYHGQEFASSFDINTGHDLFASPPDTTGHGKGKGKLDEKEDARIDKQARKEAPTQKRRKKEERRAARCKRKRKRRSRELLREQESGDGSAQQVREQKRRKRQDRSESSSSWSALQCSESGLTELC